MADVPQAFTVEGSTYSVPTTETIEPLAVSIQFNGGGIGSTWMPCLSIYAQSGELLSRTFPANSVAAGASNEVSFIPFVPPASGGAGGSGIQFDTDNVGGSLLVETTGATSGAGDAQLDGYGVAFGADEGVILRSVNTDGNNQIQLQVDGAGNSGITLSSGGEANSGMDFQAFGIGNGGINFTTSSAGSAGIALHPGVGGLVLDLAGGGFLTFTNLPIVNPGGVNRVWNNGGVLSIT